jgi:branched-chain amino acid aminotransferase
MADNHKVGASEFKRLETDQIIYEVIRVIDNKILLMNDHMNRLRRSLELVGDSSEIVDRIEDSLEILLDGHKDLDKNIKIDVYNGHYRCYFVESFYPKQELYETGVETTLYKHSRLNPEVKALNMDYKTTIEEIKAGKYFEVLLVNDEGFVLEGSRSNLLLIKDDVLISAPLGDILNGVTFRNVIRMAENLKIKVDFRRVHKNELKDVDACFITGTSLGVLPISHIDEIKYNTKHDIIKALMKAYKGGTNEACNR